VFQYKRAGNSVIRSLDSPGEWRALSLEKQERSMLIPENLLLFSPFHEERRRVLGSGERSCSMTERLPAPA